VKKVESAYYNQVLPSSISSTFQPRASNRKSPADLTGYNKIIIHGFHRYSKALWRVHLMTTSSTVKVIHGFDLVERINSFKLYDRTHETI